MNIKCTNYTALTALNKVLQLVHEALTSQGHALLRVCAYPAQKCNTRHFFARLAALGSYSKLTRAEQLETIYR